jgi:hypothetical protein
MRSLSKLNVIIGWFMFLVALVVYTLTLEPSVSLWDCGEFASAAYKLQVVHPPGAPFFLMVGRMFSLLASSPETVGFWINMLSAVSSAGAVMFTYWITVFFAEKLVSEDAQHRALLVFGAGAVAALTNTFIDTFWFSAVEAEVYAMSSFFTSLTFWAILQWYGSQDNAASDRWLIFIAFMIGLALGTHMLNLLVIPTVGLAYYFKKFKVTRNGVIYALGGSALALGIVMKVIYPGIPWLLANLDRMFVNGFGLPFYSGALVSIVLVFGGLYYFVNRFQNEGKYHLNLIFLCIGFVIFGYSSYAMVIIRSMANPAIDMNNPEDPYKFYGYITREQYGDRPLAYGPYFNAPQTDYKIKGTRYYKADTKYEKGGDIYEAVHGDVDINGDGITDNFNTIFPRMGKSNKQNDARGFRGYGGMQEVQDEIDQLNQMSQQRQLTPQENRRLNELNYQIPTFGNNMTYFFTYQIRYMYLRYFMWNFVGRFNDQQAVSGNTKMDGNWYSGIPIIDNWVVGDVASMPEYYQNQKAKNKYYFLPLILGLLGLVLQFGKAKKEFWMVMTMFIFTGLLIIVYTNQPPYEPRERDYAVVGSFQIFCIWVGLGVISLAEILRKYLKGAAAMIAVAASILLVPVNMAAENWDDHDRSGRYIGIDMGKNFLNHLDPNAVLFCNGDNDTYPLWYTQNVEGIRTDVRIINQSLLPTEWYSSVLLDTVYKSAPLPLTISKEDLQTGSFEYGIPVNKDAYKAPRPVDEVIKELRQRRAESVGATNNISWNASSMYIVVDKDAVIKSGMVHPAHKDLIVDTIKIDVGSEYFTKGDLVMYDLVSTMIKEGWKRPIYFTSVSGYDFGGLNDYMQLEGLVYKFVPIKGGSRSRQPNRIDQYKLYSNIVKNYRYYGMKDKPNFFLDDKAAYVPNDLQQMGLLLASYYAQKVSVIGQTGKELQGGRDLSKVASPEEGFSDALAFYQHYKDSAQVFKTRGVEVLTHIMTEIPENVMPMRREYRADYGLTLLALGDEKTAKKVLTESVKENVTYYKYFNSDADNGSMIAEREVYVSQDLIRKIIKSVEQENRKDWAQEFRRLSQSVGKF